MISVAIDTTQVTALLQRLAEVKEIISRQSAQAMRYLQADVIDLMQERTGPYADPTALVHEITRDLSNSLRAGPVSTTAQGVVGSVDPGVWYAAAEAGRGGIHDFPVRTVAAADPIVQEAAEDLAELICREIEGVL